MILNNELKRIKQINTVRSQFVKFVIFVVEK